MKEKINNTEIRHRSTFAVLFYINRTKVRKDGTCQLLCKIILKKDGLTAAVRMPLPSTGPLMI